MIQNPVCSHTFVFALYLPHTRTVFVQRTVFVLAANNWAYFLEVTVYLYIAVLPEVEFDRFQWI